MKKPTDRQAIEWSSRFVDEAVTRWIAEFEKHERWANEEEDPVFRAGFLMRANTFMQCAYELKDLHLTLRAMMKPDEPIPPKLKLVIDNEQNEDKAG